MELSKNRRIELENSELKRLYASKLADIAVYTTCGGYCAEQETVYERILPV